jgi:hypothetical protein
MCEDCRLVEKPTACERRPAKIEGILEMAIATGAKEFVDWAGYIDKQVQSLQEAIKVDSDIRMKKLELERLLTEYRKAR